MSNPFKEALTNKPKAPHMRDLFTRLKQGGFTCRAKDFKTVNFKTGYGVAGIGRVRKGNINKLNYQSFKAKMYTISQSGAELIGGWLDEDTYYIEPSQRIMSLEEALYLGAKRNELAIWDFKHNQEIRIVSQTETKEEY